MNGTSPLNGALAGAPNRLIGKLLTFGGVLVGALAVLATGAALTMFGVIQSDEAPRASLADTVGMLSAPFMLTGLPLGLAGTAIFAGRRLMGARPNRLFGLAGLIVGVTVTAALGDLVANSLHGRDADFAWSADLSSSEAPLWGVAIGAGLALSGLSAWELVRPRRPAT